MMHYKINLVAPLLFVMELLLSGTALAGDTANIYFKETFEDDKYTSRGWYGNTSVNVSDDEHIQGSSRSAEYFFVKGSVIPASGWAIRHEIPATNSLYISYHVKYSENWIGSGKKYHPHEFHILSDQDGKHAGPAYASLCVYVEQNEGEPLIAIQDSQNINIDKLNQNLAGAAGKKAVAGCNGDHDGYGKGGCYKYAEQNRNWKEWRTGAKLFSDEAGKYYKNDWHFIEVFLRLNDVINGQIVKNGQIKYWYDGELVLSNADIVFRTNWNPNIKLAQVLIGPYIGKGSPVDQTFWIDDLLVANKRIIKN